jgi:hypothetical protein
MASYELKDYSELQGIGKEATVAFKQRLIQHNVAEETHDELQ